MTPRLLILCDGLIAVPDTETDFTSSIRFFPRPAVNWITSDFTGFSWRPLCSSQSWTPAVHRSRRSTLDDISTFDVVIYICVSSAYWWWLTPYDRKILDSGAMYKEN